MFDSDGSESDAQEIDFDVDDQTPQENEFHDMMSDVEADADTLRCAGMGTDEDYGYFGENEF